MNIQSDFRQEEEWRRFLNLERESGRGALWSVLVQVATGKVVAQYSAKESPYPPFFRGEEVEFCGERGIVEVDHGTSGVVRVGPDKILWHWCFQGEWVRRVNVSPDGV